ncbi:MAG TPA: cysteine--tRNA ligase [Thermoplasmata archaeon]|nr:cysteine--tRNA ligase [Thermoplasmata archaeon]
MRRFSVYDSLHRGVRLFVPIHPPRVGLFVCGLTPYADAHIGHARTAVTFDVVARAIRYWGYRLFYVQNVTNLDDHLVDKGAELGVGPLELAERKFAEFRRSLDELGVRSVDLYPFATDYLAEILTQIRTLVDRGFAYPAEGSVYYEVAKFPNYGKLSGQRREEQRPGTRVEVEPGKRAPEDFVIWKAARPGEPSWESPWGPGRPGWHIEDTAITERLLGARYDLHGGGLELKFPHHEGEIALAEAATGQSPLVNYWMHAGLLTLKGEKMAKSLGNVVPLAAALEQYGAETLRFFFVNAHYRSPLDFEAGKSLEEAAEALDRLRRPLERLRAARSGRGGRAGGADLHGKVELEAVEVLEKLDAALADDFNTREAVAQLYLWGRRVTEVAPAPDELSSAALDSLEAPYAWAAEVLGLFGAPPAPSDRSLDGAVEVALAARRRARARGDFAESDRIRAELRDAGIEVEDEGERTRWRRRAPDRA